MRDLRGTIITIDARLPRRVRALVAAILACALSLGLLPARAAAQDAEASAVPHDALPNILFAAQVQTRGTGVGSVADVLLSAELLEWRRVNPNATAQQATQHFLARRQALSAALTPQDYELPEPDFAVRVAGVLTAAAPSNAAAAPFVRALLEATLGEDQATYDNRIDVASGALRTVQWLRGRHDVERALWAVVRTRARSDAVLGQAWNTVLGSPMGIDARANLDTIRQDPILRSFMDIDALVARRSDPAALAAEAERQYRVASARVQEELKQARERAQKANQDCPVSADTACTEERRKAAEKIRDIELKELAGITSAAKAFGDIVGLIDAGAGKKLTTAATAYLQIVGAVVKWTAAVAGRGTFSAIFSAATATLTGDIFSAVTTLIGLFGGSSQKPSVDQLILDAVTELRREVGALHQEMRASFARIEAQLNVVFQSMMVEFAKIEAALAGHSVSLSHIQNQLARLTLRLEEIAATILSALADGQLQDARLSVSQYIGYEERTGGAIPSFEAYDGASTDFRFAATDISRRTAFVVPAESTADPTTELETRGEAAALSYLARIANSRDAAVPYPGADIPNPAVWNFGAQAFALLQLQNPAYAARENSSSSQEIVDQGARIIETARSFSAPAAAPDATGNRTNRVFSSLMEDYRSAVSRLSSGIAGVRTGEVQVRPEPGQPAPVPKNYNLFGRPHEQAVPTKPDPAIVPACNSSAAIERPSNVSFGLVTSALRFAEYAYFDQSGQLPALDHCYTVVWTAVRTVEDEFNDGVTAKWGRLRLTISTRFRWTDTNAWSAARSASYTWGEQQISQTCRQNRNCTPWTITPHQAFARKGWSSGGRALFERDATITANTAQAHEVYFRMQGFLNGRQHYLYFTLRNALGAGGALHGDAARLNNAARLLQAFTRYGFPIALTTDDLLSALLFGQYQVLVNYPSNPQLATTFAVAAGVYTCRVEGDVVGTPCGTGRYVPSPLTPSHPHLELELGGPWWDTWLCNTSGVTGLPGDPVGDCLIASALKRLDALAARYRHHFQRLADGAYVEEVPWVASTLRMLPVVDTLVHTNPPA